MNDLITLLWGILMLLAIIAVFTFGFGVILGGVNKGSQWVRWELRLLLRGMRSIIRSALQLTARFLMMIHRNI